MRYLAILFLVFAQSTAVLADDEPNFVVLPAPAVPPDIKVHAGGTHFAFINSSSFMDGDKANEDADVWKDLRKALKSEPYAGVHVRIYTDRVDFPYSAAAKAVKIQLAELDLFVVRVDMEISNAKIPWEKRLKRFNAGSP